MRGGGHEPAQETRKHGFSRRTQTLMAQQIHIDAGERHPAVAAVLSVALPDRRSSARPGCRSNAGMFALPVRQP